MKVESRLFLGIKYPSEVAGVRKADFLKTSIKLVGKYLILFQFIVFWIPHIKKNGDSF
jgi:Fe-S cluster assembly ATPase SufC